MDEAICTKEHDLFKISQTGGIGFNWKRFHFIRGKVFKRESYKKTD
jgi:hypothetical protein